MPAVQQPEYTKFVDGRLRIYDGDVASTFLSAVLVPAWPHSEEAEEYSFTPSPAIFTALQSQANRLGTQEEFDALCNRARTDSQYEMEPRDALTLSMEGTLRNIEYLIISGSLGIKNDAEAQFNRNARKRILSEELLKAVEVIAEEAKRAGINSLAAPMMFSGLGHLGRWKSLTPGESCEKLVEGFAPILEDMHHPLQRVHLYAFGDGSYENVIPYANRVFSED